MEACWFAGKNLEQVAREDHSWDQNKSILSKKSQFDWISL
jgi:hypothetical protein